MSPLMDEETRRGATQRATASVLEIIQRKTSAAEASRGDDMPSSEVEGWLEEGGKGMTAAHPKPTTRASSRHRALDTSHPPAAPPKRRGPR